MLTVLFRGRRNVGELILCPCVFVCHANEVIPLTEWVFPFPLIDLTHFHHVQCQY